MGTRKRIISAALVLVLLFTGIPFPDLSFAGTPFAHAEGSTPAVDIVYDDFSETGNLQLNGVSLIENSAVLFEDSGDTGESVFTKDKLVLGENLSFSTAFSFRNISPSEPAEDTIGGFTFTLQSIGNSVTADDFQDTDINPSLSIAFTAEYWPEAIPTRIFEPAVATRSLMDVTLASEPPTRCVLSAAPYTGGDYISSINQWQIDSYNTADESSDYYRVWLGYDGNEGGLDILCLDPFGTYSFYSSDYFNLADAMLPGEVYAGFMGSLGNAGNTSEIGSWYFKNDLSIMNEAIAEADEALLIYEMEMYEAEPVEDLYLPSYGQYGSEISWISGNTDVVAEDGTVNPPSLGEENQTVTLTATVQKGSAVRNVRPFTVTIKVPDSEIASADYNWLTETLILRDNDALNNIVSDLTLPAFGHYGSTISWYSTDDATVSPDGTVTRAAFSEGDKTVTLTAYINMGCVTEIKYFDVTVKALGITDAEIADADYLWLTDAQVLDGNSSLNNVSYNLSLSASGKYGSTIEWQSSDEETVALDGTVTVPALGEADRTVTLTAIIRKGEEVRGKEFNLTVKVSDEDVASADAAWLTDTLILNGNIALNHVVSNLYLPASGNYGSTIYWVSSNRSVVSTEGIVTRPILGRRNEEVILRATVFCGDSAPHGIPFTVTVRAVGLSDREMVADDKLWLTDDLIKNSNTSLSSAVSDLYLPTTGGNHGSTISWETSDDALVDTSGAVTRPAYVIGDKTVNLTATLNLGTAAPETKTFTVTVKAIDRTDEEKVQADYNWLDSSVILNGNSALNNVTGDLSLPVTGAAGSSISWSSSDTSAVSTAGAVTRPAFTKGDKTVILTATLSLGTATPGTKTFTVQVKALEETDEEKVQADYNWLDSSVILNGNSALNEITQDLLLPIAGDSGSSISWSSSDELAMSTAGAVTRPAYAKGDKIVDLRATLNLGAAAPVTKLFTIVVKTLEETDEEKVQADYNWLDASVILNENSALTNVTGDLSLPLTGGRGSSISWSSSDTSVVSEDGTVTRPKYTAGAKSVTLTATINKGLFTAEKTFTVTVAAKTVITDEELVETDYEWLTEERILNGNSSLDNVLRDLYLPTVGKFGYGGSHISWASGSHGFVTIGGNVYRPMFHVGNQTVTLTATISKGSSVLNKTFTVTVICLDLTDNESINEDAKWLMRYDILGENLSASAVVNDLSWPLTGPYASAITWHSDNTNIISNDGTVSRPENKAGNRRVNVTATVSKGAEQITLTFQYIVLQEPDRSPPVVTAAVPGNGSTGVLWNTDKITITYSEDIVFAQGSDITLGTSEPVQFTAYGEKNKLVITPLSALNSGENRLLIPRGAVSDQAGNPADAYELIFSVEEKLIKEFKVISSSPYDTEKDVDVNLSQISFRFDSAEIVKGLHFDRQIALRTMGKVLSISRSLSSDTVTLRILEVLEPATVYEIVISEGVVQDRFLNTNETKIIQFRTKGLPTPEVKLPEIAGVYPADGQTNVSVNTNIELTLADTKELKVYPKLTDEFGTEYPLYAPYTMDFVKTKLIFKPRVSLKPNMTYTLSGPYLSAADTSSEGFSTQFTTGSGLRITKTAPATGDSNAATRGIVEIYFSSPVAKGDNYDGIVFEDYFGDPVDFVGEEIGSKVVLRTVSELDKYIPYSVFIPSGAFESSSGEINDQNKITFIATQEKLPTSLEPSYLDIPDTGFVGKAVKIGFDTNEMTSWVQDVRAFGYGPVSYEWHIDGILAGTAGLLYRTFSVPGEHVIRLTAKDKYGYSYSVEKTVEIQALQDVRMTLKGSGTVMKINTWEAAVYPELRFELRLEQDSRFIYGERIGVKLYKEGVLQPLTVFADGGVTITSNYGDNAYLYSHKPDEGDFGVYELEFTYNGPNGKQVIRQPFIVASKAPATTDVFRFRMCGKQSATYFEELNYVYVQINGERLRAEKEMYTPGDSTYPVYTLHKTLATDTYYEFNVEDWWWEARNRPLYIGKDTDTPTILFGNIKSISTGMQIKSVSINDSESELKEYNRVFFEGLSTRLVFDVEGDWAGKDVGYYEIASLNMDEGASRYGDEGFKSILLQNHNNNIPVQKITVRPGTQIKDKMEMYWIRMVSSQGYKSAWEMCPDVSVMPMPSVLGKKLNVSVQDGEYAVNWPTVFDGPIGGTISFLDGIPVVGGGNFGLGGGMPKFEGQMLESGDIWLSFDAKGGYGEESKTTKNTSFKKLKKVSVVGYTFEMELEGGIKLEYHWDVDEWDIGLMYIIIDGRGGKFWDEGYEFLGVGFTAGVGIGADVFGYLQVKNDDDISYSGIVRITPNANLHVDGDFKVASVTGSLTARIPAEIHFPTGYIGADITVDALITAKALLWSKTLYEKNLAKLHWDNGKERVSLYSRTSAAEGTGAEMDTRAELMPRDYLSRQSLWLGGNDSAEKTEDTGGLRRLSLMAAELEANPKTADMMENIFPEAEMTSAFSGSRQYLLWTDDNPSRDAVNRTQLRITHSQDGTWSAPEWFNDDGTADFAPSAAAAGDGILIAWQNISRALSEEEGLTDMLKSTEISVTENVYTADGYSGNIITLTNDGKINHSPRIAADGGRALLVWTSSEDMGIDFTGEESSISTPGDQLFFSVWSGGTWAAPEAIGAEYSTVLDTCLVMKSEEALLLYTLDMDNDLYTGGDREVFARLYDGTGWGDELRLTENAVNDSAPKAAYVDGEWFITWLRDGKITYKTGLSGETRTEERLGNIQSDYRLTATEGERPLAALLYKQPGEKMALGIYASCYDFNNDTWSDKAGLVTEDVYVKAITAAFDGEGKLNAAYTEADIITEARPETLDGIEELVEFESISDKVSLKLLTYTPVHDLAVPEKDGMTLSTEFPLPGAVTTVYVIVQNEGDYAENAVLSLYDGNPEEGGVIIAETAPMLIPARTETEIEAGWLVGAEGKNVYDLYAVVSTNDSVREIRTDNNTANIMVATSDIAIKNFSCENLAADNYLLNVTVVNRGSSTVEGAELRMEDESDGAVIMTAALKTLEIGEEALLTYLIPSDGHKNMRMRVALPDGVNESNTDNNTRSFTFEPRLFAVKSLNIAPGDKQVDVASEFRLDFNMDIGRGSGFDRIRLMDEELNEAAISKEIENNTLYIRPTQVMEVGTGYQLTIPADALGDAYGHTLGKAIKIGFTTASTNPEIVSAYPGNFMENAAIDTKIRLMFNQRDIQQGYEFSKIALYEHSDGSGTKTVPVAAALDGDLLTVNYAGSLSDNATYVLEIPRGAVDNSMGDTLREDYQLAFSTGGTTGGNEPGEEDFGDSDSYYEQITNISLGGTEKSVLVRTNGGSSTIKLDALAQEIFTGNEQTVLDIPNITGVNSYTFEMPAESLASSGTASLTVNTALGSISIPSDMLSAMEERVGKTVGIRIAAAIEADLSADVKALVGDRPVLQLTLTLDGMETAWDNPGAPVMVSIPYTPTAAEAESPESIVILYIDGDGNAVSIPNGSYNALTGRVSFAVTHFSTFAVAYNRVSFKDVPESAWYYRAVNFIAARGITLGTGNGNFSPGDCLTRGQFITMMMKAYGIGQETDAKDNFRDAGNTWYTGYLAAAKHLGISEGTGDNLFSPDREITRQEMFTLFYKTLKLIDQLAIENGGKSLTDFGDSVQIAPWAKDAMEVFVQTGVIKGDGGKLSPEDTGNRAQMAQMIYNLLMR